VRVAIHQDIKEQQISVPNAIKRNTTTPQIPTTLLLELPFSAKIATPPAQDGIRHYFQITTIIMP
jgi:hypothetical protein